MHAALDTATWPVAASLASTLLRPLPGGLTAQAARRALAATGDSEPEAQLRACRLTVLRALRERPEEGRGW